MELLKLMKSERFGLTTFIVLILLVAHVALVTRQFPLSSLTDGGLPVKGDVARYLATVDGVQRIGGDGYDPLAMAGYPVGLWNSMGKKGYEILIPLIPGGALGNRFYLLLMMVSLLSPLILFFVARKIEKDSPTPLVLLFSLTVWHFDSQVAFFWSFGNVLYPATCALLPAILLLGWQVCNRERPLAAAVGLGVISAWVFYAHTVVLFACTAPMAGLVVSSVLKRRSAAPIVWISLASATGLLIAAPWFVELCLNVGDSVPQPYQWFQAGPKHLLSDILSDRSYGRPFDRNLILHFVVVAGVAGSILARQKENHQVGFIGLGGLWCLFIAYTFSYIPSLRSIQPYRFLVPAVICLSIPALVATFDGWKIYKTSSASGRRLVMAGSLIFFPGATAYILDILQPPLHCGLSPEEVELLNKIRELPSSGRIICQPDQVAHLIPFWCKKPVLGGLNDQAFLKHRFSGMLEAGICNPSPP